MNPFFAVLLFVCALMNAAWTWSWHSATQEQRHQVGFRLATLISAETQERLQSEPFHPGAALQRVAGLPGISAARLNSADGRLLWQSGAPQPGPWWPAPVTEGGEHLGTLGLQFSPVAPPPVLWLSWTALLGAVAYTFRRKAPASSSQSGALILELDPQRRIRRMTGDLGLLGAPAPTAVGQTLESVMSGGALSSRRTISERGAVGLSGPGSLVVVRDSSDARRMARRLHQLEEQYRNLCDFAHDLILVAEPEGNLIFTNRALQARCPSSGARAVFELFTSENQAVVHEAFTRCLMEGKEARLEVQLRTDQPGRSVPLRGYFCPGEWQSGVPTTVLGIFTDLSEQRKAEAELRQAQKMEAVGRLAGGVAHDFNNLLTVLSSLGSLMRHDLTDTASLQESLNDLDVTIARAAELTRQLLLFSRKKVSRDEPLEFDVVVGEIAKLARRLIGEDVQLDLQLQARAWICADRSELEQVLMNLIVNARDALPGGGQIRVYTRSTDQHVVLEVSDNGVGMSDEVRSQIFEPYYTTKEVGKGTGLGLSTTYAIITRWNGSIEVDSEVGKGTRFRFLLPRCAAAAATAVSRPLPAPPSSDGLVLLVEDEPALCRTAVKCLQMKGYEVVGFVTPAEALSWLKDTPRPPRVLVTDVVMPVMNGVELAEKARSLVPELKVLYVSGYPGESLQRLQSDQREHFLAKPYRGEELAGRLEELLQC